MATVEPYSLGNGQRRYRVRYRTPDRRSTEKRGFTTKKAAQDWAATVGVSKMMGTYVPPSAGRVTVGEVAEGWLTSVGRLKATTKAARQSAWEHRVKPRWEHVPIGDVRPSQVQEWVRDLVAEGVGSASIESALVILRGALQSAVDDRALATNPVANIRAPRRKHQRRGYLTHRQVRALISEVDDAVSVTVILFLAYTGLRWGEMAALKVGSFDMLRRRVNIAEAVAEVRGQLVWDTPKSHERRSVPFPAFLAEPLAVLMQGRGRDDLMFAGPKGAVLRVSTFRPRVFAPAVARCQEKDRDFPTVTPHDLRHSAASLAISAGANVKAVQTMLGHKSAAMTLDTYSDLFPDDLDAVAARLDEVVRAEGVGVLWVRGSPTSGQPTRSGL